MTRRPLTLVLVVIACAAIGLPGWAVTVYRLHPVESAVALKQAPLDARLLARFQAMAETACRCTREHGGEKALGTCWSGYDRETAPYKSGSMATACGENSGEWDCFGKDCALTVTVNRMPEGLCSDEERRIADAIWAPAMTGSMGEYKSKAAYDRARAAYDRAYDAFVHGRKVAMPSSSKRDGLGCGAG
jgi:hypothetical protein